MRARVGGACDGHTKEVDDVVCIIAGLEELRTEIRRDHKDKPIKDLCVIDNGKVIFSLLHLALPLEDIPMKFDFMFSKYQNKLFEKIWDDHLKKARRKSESELTIASIKTDIWDPSFHRSLTLLDSLRDRSIKLSEVDQYFKEVKDRERQISALCSGVEMCKDGRVIGDGHQWISTAVHMMDGYWSICKLAEIIMELKEITKLSGDFSLVEGIASQVM